MDVRLSLSEEASRFPGEVGGLVCIFERCGLLMPSEVSLHLEGVGSSVGGSSSSRATEAVSSVLLWLVEAKRNSHSLANLMDVVFYSDSLSIPSFEGIVEQFILWLDIRQGPLQQLHVLQNPRCPAKAWTVLIEGNQQRVFFLLPLLFTLKVANLHIHVVPLQTALSSVHPRPSNGALHLDPFLWCRILQLQCVLDFVFRGDLGHLPCVPRLVLRELCVKLQIDDAYCGLIRTLFELDCTRVSLCSPRDIN